MKTINAYIRFAAVVMWFAAIAGAVFGGLVGLVLPPLKPTPMIYSDKQ